MKKYSKQILILWLVFLIAAIPSLTVSGMEKTTIGLLKINNYSGVDSVGGTKLEKLVVNEFVINFKYLTQPKLTRLRLPMVIST